VIGKAALAELLHVRHHARCSVGVIDMAKRNIGAFPSKGVGNRCADAPAAAGNESLFAGEFWSSGHHDPATSFETKQLSVLLASNMPPRSVMPMLNWQLAMGAERRAPLRLASTGTVFAGNAPKPFAFRRDIWMIRVLRKLFELAYGDYLTLEYVRSAHSRSLGDSISGSNTYNTNDVFAEIWQD